MTMHIGSFEDNFFPTKDGEIRHICELAIYRFVWKCSAEQNLSVKFRCWHKKPIRKGFCRRGVAEFSLTGRTFGIYMKGCRDAIRFRTSNYWAVWRAMLKVWSVSNWEINHLFCSFHSDQKNCLILYCKMDGFQKLATIVTNFSFRTTTFLHIGNLPNIYAYSFIRQTKLGSKPRKHAFHVHHRCSMVFKNNKTQLRPSKKTAVSEAQPCRCYLRLQLWNRITIWYRMHWERVSLFTINV